MTRAWLPLIGLGLTAGCALKGDVRRVELQVEALRVERGRGDSVRAVQIDSVRALLAAVQEKLTAQQAYLVQLRGDMKTELLAVQQQLVTVQELTGQSQQRLTELRGKLEEQARQPVPVPDTGHGGAPIPGGPSGNPGGGGGPGAESDVRAVAVAVPPGEPRHGATRISRVSAHVPDPRAGGRRAVLRG